MFSENKDNLEGPKNVVLIKQVPNMDEVEFDSEKGRIDRGSAGAETNPFDLNALEAAVKIKEDIGGSVTSISMGPPQAKSALREALQRGADRGILLTGKKFAGSDTLATSYTLCSAIRKLKEFDFVFCGEKTIDGDTGQVGPEVAEHLKIPQVTYVLEIVDYDPKELVVITNLGKYKYTVKIESPALITVTKDLNEPRYLSYTQRKEASKLDVETWSFGDLKGDKEEKFGLKGSQTQVHNIEIPSRRLEKGEIFEGPLERATTKLVDRLEKRIQL